MLSKVDFYPKSLQRKYNVELLYSAFKLAEIRFPSCSSEDPRGFLLPGLRNLLRLSSHTRFLSYTPSSRASHSCTLFHASSAAFDSQLE